MLVQQVVSECRKIRNREEVKWQGIDAVHKFI